MRNLVRMREIVSEAPPPNFSRKEVPAFCVEGSQPMLHELIPSSPAAKWTCVPGSRSTWAYAPERLLRHPEAESGLRPEHLPAEPVPLAHSCMTRKIESQEKKEEEGAATNEGHSLFQELFFFCTVKDVGDIPGARCIYVETVVDRDSGVAFAKVYPSKNAMNAVDILASRVVPFFERRGVAINEIHTRKTSEYCGLPPVHPFETYLATSHIEHLTKSQYSHPDNYLCEEFYRFLLKEFFLPALRKTFRLSFENLQKDLDAFVEMYNALQMKHENQMKIATHP
jgi:hypothetical protein